MIGYKRNNFAAIVSPKKMMDFGFGFLLPELDYFIKFQEEPINIPNGLKRSFICGNGISMWIGIDIEENFNIIKVIRS